MRSRKWRNPSRPEPWDGTLAKVPLMVGPSGYQTGVKGTTKKETNILEINKLCTTKPVLQYSRRYIPEKDFTLELLLPYKTNPIAFHTQNYYFDKAANQVRACVRGFIEEELHGESTAWWRLGGIMEHDKKLR
jgi:hypothetical protein